MAIAQTFSQTNANLESELPEFISAKDFMDLVTECNSPFFSEDSMRFHGTRSNSVHVYKRTNDGYLFSHKSFVNDDEKRHYLVEATFTTTQREDGFYHLSVDFDTKATYSTLYQLRKDI